METSASFDARSAPSPYPTSMLFGGHEGDLIRAMRRLIDLLRQLAESSEVTPPLGALLGRAARVIDRGIVLESALI